MHLYICYRCLTRNIPEDKMFSAYRLQHSGLCHACNEAAGINLLTCGSRTNGKETTGAQPAVK